MIFLLFFFCHFGVGLGVRVVSEIQVLETEPEISLE